LEAESIHTFVIDEQMAYAKSTEDVVPTVALTVLVTPSSFVNSSTTPATAQSAASAQAQRLVLLRARRCRLQRNRQFCRSMASGGRERIGVPETNATRHGAGARRNGAAERWRRLSGSNDL
jgi:hypothetical protein